MTSAILNADKIGCGEHGQLNDCLGLRPGVFVTRSSCVHHVIIWTNQNQADVLRLSPCVNVKLIHAERSDRKISMPPDLNPGVRDTKTRQLAILSPPYLCYNVKGQETCESSSIRNGTYKALGKAHKYTLRPVSRKFPPCLL